LYIRSGWELNTGDGGSSRTVRLGDTKHRSNNSAVLRHLAIAGHGLVQLPDFIVGADIEEGRLVPVRYMASNDLDFATKAADIIGLYLNPPAHAAVFCVDEKTAIQSLDRKDPVLPLSPGRVERHGFEYYQYYQYYRHGTLSLYAAFNTQTGEVLGKTAERHTSAEFVAFLTDIVINQPRGKEIHVIADNLSAHKSVPVKEFLEAHPKVHLHFTPTYSSWLNQVELWFGKIERDVIARGVFTSVSDLKRKLMRYIRQYNKSPRTVKWKYADPSRHIGTKSVVTGH
jgi:transposase